jgi:hypothetical protein
VPALSVSEAVGDAIGAAVAALALPGVTVARRKLPALPEGAVTPQVVVSIGAEGPVEPIDATRDLVSYPVAVTIVTATGAQAADDATVRDWRQRIRRKVQDVATWAAVSGWNAVRTEGKEPFDPQALPKDFNFSTQVFTVEVLESRT